MRIPKRFLTLLFFLLLAAQPAGVCWSAAASLEALHSQSPYLPGGDYPILFRIQVKEPWYLHGTKAGEEGLIPTALRVPAEGDVRLTDIRFPQPRKKQFPYTRDAVEVFSGEIPVTARLAVDREAGAGERRLEVLLSYQACSESACLPPEKVTLEVALEVGPPGSRVNLLNPELFVAAGSPSGGSGAAWDPGPGFLLALLGIFLGGLALNLTPCVYPLIPITVSYFGGQGRGLAGRAPLHSLLYVSGLAVTNSALGVTAALSGGLLGSALQNPLTLLAVAGVLTALALSFFGFWELRLPAGLTALAGRHFSGYFGTFFMGLTLGIVAAPCIGPFILGLLTYVGQKGDPLLGFAYFFTLSLGLGLPLAALGLFAGRANRLPHSGEWMVWVKQGMGWVLIAMAAYVLWPLLPGEAWRAGAMLLIAVAAAGHLGWRTVSPGDSSKARLVKRGIGLIVVAAGVWYFQASQAERPGVGWLPFQEAELKRAVAEGRPVMLDFYADWCLPCRELDERVFRDRRVVELSRRFLPLRVDLTRKRADQPDLLERFDVRGVPSVLFFDRDGRELKSLRLESFVKAAEVLERMRRALNTGFSAPGEAPSAGARPWPAREFVSRARG